MTKITPIPAFNDNYIWLLQQHKHNHCLVVDPGCANSVLSYLEQHQLTLHTILITHHHQDHTGGITRLREAFPALQVIGPAAERDKMPALDHYIGDGDLVDLPDFELQFRVISVPGHTLGHVAYYSAPVLFCGDTLFSAGCGRLFEGTPAQMWYSLQQLMALPDGTQIYCTHEYTLANIKFALMAEPTNIDLVEYAAQCMALRQQNKPTLPTELRLEKNINPFLRCNNKALQQKWQENSALALFTALRAAKDGFKG